MQQCFSSKKKQQTHSPNRRHWRLLIKRLLWSSHSEVPEVSKEEGSRTSHKLFQCLTTLNSNFFLLVLTWSFPYYIHFLIPSLSRGWRPHPPALSALPASGWAKLGSVASCPGRHSRLWMPSLSPVCHVPQRGPNTGHGLLGGTQLPTDGEWHQHAQRLQTTNVHKHCEQYDQPNMLHKHSNNNYISSTTHTDINYFSPSLKCWINHHQSWKISM